MEDGRLGEENGGKDEDGGVTAKVLHEGRKQRVKVEEERAALGRKTQPDTLRGACLVLKRLMNT